MRVDPRVDVPGAAQTGVTGDLGVTGDFEAERRVPGGRLSNYVRFTTVVLEARGVLERVPRSSRQRVRRAQPHDALRDELIAFGWTDGIRHRIDDEKSHQLISPRRTRPWVRSYKDRAEKLIATEPPASDRFNAFSPSTRRNILRGIESARTTLTRKGRIALTASEAQQGRAAKSNG